MKFLKFIPILFIFFGNATYKNAVHADIKNPEEYTSPIQKIFKVGECYIICTENSIYIVSNSISTKKIS